MFDVKAIRDNPTWFDDGLQRRSLSAEFSSSKVISLDDQRRAIITALQDAQSQRNTASKEIGKAKGAKDDVRAAKLMAEVAGLKESIAAGEVEQAKVDAAIQAMLEVIPNVPLDEVPLGVDETGNVEVRRVGEPSKLSGMNKPLQHFEIGEAMGLMDFETAAKVSGARFVYLKGQLARLERALAQFMLDIHTEEFGYTEVNPPMLVRDAAAYGTANLPKFAEDLFRIIGPLDKLAQEAKLNGAAIDSSESTLKIVKQILRQLSSQIEKTAGAGPRELGWLKSIYDSAEEVANLEQARINDIVIATEGLLKRARDLASQQTANFWLIPTAEVSLTNLVRESILDEDKLPLRFTAWTPCFRSEAGSAGRDTRGMIRQHQFSKVELVSITTPEKSLAEHERMTNAAETILQRLGLAYRTVLLCTGDMGFAAQKTYDIEVWLPGQNAYREISSCSVCGDFQARRMGARYRPKGSKDIRYLHTLNGSGLAVGRTLVAILENYQQADGSVAIPAALQSYMGGKTVISKP